MCSESWKSFIRYLRRSSDDTIIDFFHNMFPLSFPSPEYPRSCAVLGFNMVELHANMNRCEFSFIIACSISFCDVTCGTQPYSVCSTFLIATDLRLPKCCEHRLHRFFSLSEVILCCFWVDSKCLFLCEKAEYISFRCNIMPLVIFCLVFSMVTLWNHAILTSLDRERISVKQFFLFSLFLKKSF